MQTQLRRLNTDKILSRNQLRQAMQKSQVARVSSPNLQTTSSFQRIVG